MATRHDDDPQAAALPIEHLLAPRSVAIVGASPDPGTLGGAVLANFERFGFEGDLHLVGRRHAQIARRPCVPSIDDLPDGVDVVVLVIGESSVHDAVVQCVRRGARSAVVFAAGFAEVGPEGARRQAHLSAIAREGGLALAGPNCIGITNHVARVPLTFEPVDAVMLDEPAGVAILAQSGGVVSHLRPALQSRGVPVAYAVSTGNEAVLGIEDYLPVLVEDEHVGLVLVFAEQIRRPAVFVASMQRASALGKPVVLMQPGRSQGAREAAQSHTGALAGDHALIEAILKSHGVVVAATLDELVDVAAVLMRFPTPAPGGVAILTNSGALRGITLDFCEDLGLPVAPLSPDTVSQVREMLPTYAASGNPVDVTTAGATDPGVFERVGKVLLDDPATASLLVAVLGGGPQQQCRKVQALCRLPAGAKPTAIAMLGDEAPLDAEAVRLLRERRLPMFRSPDRALRALARVAEYAGVRAAAARNEARTVVGPLTLPGRGVLPEHLGKRLLAEAGFRIPEGRLAKSPAEALAIASHIGYPVVLKAQARTLAHKSDAGGVVLDVRSDEALRQGWHRIGANVREAHPDLVLDGILVEAMARPGLEMLVGARRDRDWGPVVLFGIGGVLAEALDDVRLLAASADRESIRGELRKLRSARLLRGFRGAAPPDEAALAEAIVRLGALMTAMPQVVEIDINPLVVYPDAQGVLAIDALVVAGDDGNA